MKCCAHCGGDLVRHGVTRYKTDAKIVGIRYKCRECKKSFTVRIPTELDSREPIKFNSTGRPHYCDWRMKNINITEAMTQ